jgi:hypothetical protein
MNVFKHTITLSVILLTMWSAAPAFAQWGYAIHPPKAPNLTRSKTLTNPTVEQIQKAITPNTWVKVHGTVNARSGAVINIDVANVRLDFRRAERVDWRGHDTWSGFISISGSRVEVLGVRMSANSAGKCRGVTLFTPASDVRISGCEFRNTADGLVGDGEFARILIENSSFLNCGNFQNTSWEGGYGIFLQDKDWNDDHIHLNNVKVTLAKGATQHGIRVSSVQRMLVENSDIGANEKRSFWAYGVDRLCLRNSVFRDGSVLFSLMGHEKYSTRPLSRVRLDNCTIRHTGIMQPINLYCSTGTRNFRMRNVNITSTSSEDWMQLNWRTKDSQIIRWTGVTFNGRAMNGWGKIRVFGWERQEMINNRIGPFPFPG